MGKYDEALEIIKRENPFPAVCGAVCARFCEQVCTRGDVDAPVAIDEIKKFVSQLELDPEKRFVPKKKFNKGHKIAVVGSGPAGLSCAYYLAVLGHDVTVFEKEKLAGGMMVYGIPNFRLEKDVVNAEIEVLKELGVDYEHLVPAIVQEIGRKTLGGAAELGRGILTGREGYENLRK